jgi:hypothetical protein
MKKILLASVSISILFLSACTSVSKQKNEVAGSTKAQERKPAAHYYAGFDCTSENIDLKYDGPGSNYAVGGYSNFYANNKKDKDGNRLAVLAYSEPEGRDFKLGEKITDATVEIDFGLDTAQEIPGTSKNSGPKVGDKCEPNDVEYSESEYQVYQKVIINRITTKASKILNLAPKQVITLKCTHTSASPNRCPESGVYGVDDI